MKIWAKNHLIRIKPQEIVIINLIITALIDKIMFCALLFKTCETFLKIH